MSQRSGSVFVVEFAGLGADLSAGTSYADALTVCRAVASAGMRSGDLAAYARAERAAAECCRRLGKVRSAEEGFQRAARCYWQLGHREEYARTLWFHANLKRQLGDFRGSIHQLHRARALFEQGKVPSLEAYLLAGLAESARILGHYSIAERYHIAAGAMFRQLGDVRGVLWAREGLAQIRKCEGRFNEAYALFSAAASLAQQIGDRRAEGWGLRGMGEVLGQVGETDRARVFLLKALSSFEDGSCVVGKAFVLLSLAKLGGRTGREGEAAQLFAAAKCAFQEASDERGLAYLAQALGDYHSEAGRRDIGVEVSRTALQWFRDRGVKHGAFLANYRLMALGLSPERECFGAQEERLIPAPSLRIDDCQQVAVHSRRAEAPPHDPEDAGERFLASANTSLQRTVELALLALPPVSSGR